MGDNLSDYSFPVKEVLAVLGVLVVLWVGYGFFNSAPESVADPSRGLVDALAHDNLDRIKSYASEGTRDDVVRWYDVIHGQLVKLRAGWPSKEAAVQILIVEEDYAKHKGVVEAFLLPSAGTQTASVVPTTAPAPDSKTTAPAGPLGFQLHWLWEGGHWRLDGRTSLALASRSID